MSALELELEAEAQTISAFKSTVEELAQAELQRLEDEKDELTTRLASVNESLRQVKSVITATQPKEAKPKKPTENRTSPRVGEEAKQEILDWFSSLNGDEVTANKLRAAFPNRSGSFANIVLKQLREEGLIRLAGQSGATMIYKAL